MVKKKRVIVAMSGGVDSSIAAAILKKQGYEVIGIFMKLWSDNRSGLSTALEVKENICCSVEAATAARAVANKLKIPFYIVNLEKEFKKAVVDYYIKEYESGRTPNPCVVCNRDIKGEVLMRKVAEMKADFLATGHYARIAREVKSQKSKVKTTIHKLLTSIDETKDQTYFLWTLTQKQLSKLLFPIGDYTKPEVRRMAAKWKLPTAERKESQGICFIPDRDVCGFLRRHAKKLTEPGPIYDMRAKKLGMHNGLISYTIGQRERLNIGGSRAYYVVKLNVGDNSLIVGDDKDLYSQELVVKSLNWTRLPARQVRPVSPKKIELGKIGGRIRYGHPIESCKLLAVSRKQIKVIFDKPQRAITPGQSIVFYSQEEILGGGIIG